MELDGQLAQLYARALVTIARADGEISLRELVALRMFTNALGISEDDFTRLAGAHAHYLPR